MLLDQSPFQNGCKQAAARLEARPISPREPPADTSTRNIMRSKPTVLCSRRSRATGDRAYNQQHHKTSACGISTSALLRQRAEFQYQHTPWQNLLQNLPRSHNTIHHHTIPHHVIPMPTEQSSLASCDLPRLSPSVPSLQVSPVLDLAGHLQLRHIHCDSNAEISSYHLNELFPRDNTSGGRGGLPLSTVSEPKLIDDWVVRQTRATGRKRCETRSGHTRKGQVDFTSRERLNLDLHE